MDDCASAGFDAIAFDSCPWACAAVARISEDVSRARAKFGLVQPYVMFKAPSSAQELASTSEGVRSHPPAGRRPRTRSGPPDWNESLEADLAPLENRVHVLGFVERDDLEALLAGADVFCLPSLKEGFACPCSRR